LRHILKNGSAIKALGDEAFGKEEYYRALDFYGQALLRLDTLGESEEDARSGLRAALHSSMAQSYYRIEDFWRAVESAKLCLALNVGQPEAHAILKELAPNLLASGGANAVDPVSSPDDARAHPEGEADVEAANRLVKGLLQMKDDGNAALQAGRANDADAAYSRAIARLEEVQHELVGLESSSLKATLFANRSQARLSLTCWDDALADAEACLKLQPENAKALHRRKIAQEKLAAAANERERGEALKAALMRKATGNKRLAEGDGRAAAEEYSQGLEWLEDLSETEEAVREVRVALLANRAQARLRLKHWAEALADADAALLSDGRHAKARFRRCRALVELGRGGEAIEELERMCKAEPANADVRDLLDRARAVACGEPAAPTSMAVFETTMPLASAARADAAERFRIGDLITFREEFDPGDGRPLLARGVTGRVVQVRVCGGLLVELAGSRSGDPPKLVPQRCLAKCAKVRHDRHRSSETEAQRLLRESEAALDAGRLKEALTLALGAVGCAEAEVSQVATAPELLPVAPTAVPRDGAVFAGGRGVARPPPPDGAREARQLLLAYAMETRCRLALRDFKFAADAALRAVKVHAWGVARAREALGGDDMPLALQGSAALVEQLAAVAEAASRHLAGANAALSACERCAEDAKEAAIEGLRLLERRPWAPAGSLRAELHTALGEAAAAAGDAVACRTEAERAIALDAGAARAQALLATL